MYLYERLQKAEFESRRELRSFLHAIYHDLRSPLMGTSIVLQNLLKKSQEEVILSSKIIERLLESNSRQIKLINSLQQAYSLEFSGVKINARSLQFRSIITSILFRL